MSAPRAPAHDFSTQPVAVPQPAAAAPDRASRLASRLPFWLGVGVFLFYVLALAPGPYWLDSQELGAAGVNLGSAHPTGFPLFCVLARVAAWLPVGELAFRVHLVSALCTAVAAGLTARLAAELAAGDRTAAVAGGGAGLLLAGSATVFRSATVTEVYAPTLMLLALALWLLIRVVRSGDRRLGLALCFVAGLGLFGVHGSFRLIMALPVLALLGWQLRGGARWPLFGPMLGALGAAAMVAYLPLRSASGHVPLLDWGHPQTLHALWEHAATAARITRAFGGEMWQGGASLGDHLARVLADVEADVGVIGLLFAGAGLVVLLWNRRLRLAGVIVLFVAGVDLAYALWVNPMGQLERQNGTPLALALALAAGVGVTALARRFFRAAPYVAAVLAVMAATPAVLADGAAKRAVAASDAPRRWSEAALAAAPPRGLLLVESDNLAAGLFWLQLVEGQRPDLAVIVRQHVADKLRTRAVLARVGQPPLSQWLAGKAGTILWDLGQDGMPPGLAGDLGAPVMTLTPGQAASRRGLPEAIALLERTFAGRVDGDENARRQHGRALVNLGRQALAAQDPGAAMRLFAAAHAADDGNAVALTNLGVLAARQGDMQAAADYALAAVARDPGGATARVNAARYLLQLGRDAEALAQVSAVLARAPERADVHALRGVLAARAGDMVTARRELERALALDPDDIDARNNLAKLPR